MAPVATDLAQVRLRLNAPHLEEAWDEALRQIRRRRRMPTLLAAKGLMEATLHSDIAWRFVVAGAAELAKDSITAIHYESLRSVVSGQTDVVGRQEVPTLV